MVSAAPRCCRYRGRPVRSSKTGRVRSSGCATSSKAALRWDGAVDDYLGEHSVDDAVRLYDAGALNAGGRKPSHDCKGAWHRPDGRGRTFYVGRRANGKMLRVYEKGMQLGLPWHPWVRWELELHNKSRVIPFDALLEPGRYFVGAFPKALAWVQRDMSRIATIQKSTQLSYEHLVKAGSVAYGALINVMRQAGLTGDEIVERLVRPGAPRRLKHPLLDRPGEWVE